MLFSLRLGIQTGNYNKCKLDIFPECEWLPNEYSLIFLDDFTEKWVQTIAAMTSTPGLNQEQKKTTLTLGLGIEFALKSNAQLARSLNVLGRQNERLLKKLEEMEKVIMTSTHFSGPIPKIKKKNISQYYRMSVTKKMPTIFKLFFDVYPIGYFFQFLYNYLQRS